MVTTRYSYIIDLLIGAGAHASNERTLKQANVLSFSLEVSNLSK